MILGEYDRYVPSMPGPRNVDVLAHSPVPGQSNWSDITYYTAPGNGGGVLASGSASFVSMLSTTGGIPSLVIPGPFPGITDIVRRAMENVYGRFGLGPASSYGSSGGNWTEVYSGAAAGAASAAGHRVGLTVRATDLGHATTRSCHPPTIEPQKWRIPKKTAPGRAVRSPGACWRSSDSQVWC